MKNETIIVKENVLGVIVSAVNKMVDVIRPTFGPASNKVLIDSPIYFNPLPVDDGVQIARDLKLNDPVENAIVKLVREVAVKTNDRVGDGTTSSLIMLQAIINEVARKNRVNGRQIELELKRGLEDVKKALQKQARPIKTKEELKKVALISFDNELIAEMIADLYFKLGKDAVITIDKSSAMETVCETTNGIKIDKGYISPYMIINPERMESVIEKPYILITDYRLTEAGDLLSIMNKMAEANKRELVVICENMEQSALATAVVNKVQGKFLTIAVNLPSGGNTKVKLEDIALLTGAKLFTESKGNKLEEATLEDLGRAERFICRKDESIIVSPKGDKKSVKESTALLELAIKNEKRESAKKELLERLGVFKNTLAVIKVGAPTENEQKALKYKVEDAVNAVKSAFKGGVVCGGGLSLKRLDTSSPILNEALKYPHRQLCENMGLVLENLSLSQKSAVNVVTNQVGDFMEIGVIDPVDVLIAGVESAVSIASILITMSSIVVEIPKEKEN